MRDYPHLNDTAFPGMDNVNVYDYKNTFNYTRWKPGTRIKLCRVPWCNDYDHVVKFDNDEKREEYFETLKGDSIVLTSMTNALPGEVIKLPVPYDVACQYNYIVVDFPVMTSPTEPIDFEKLERKNRWFYFLSDIHSLAPNTTECIINVDYWTTFINDIDITYLTLERGHAPLAASDVESYLDNPVENNELLLAPDVNFGTCNRVASSDAHIFNGKGMYACIACSGDLSSTWPDYSIPALDLATMQGVPAPVVFATRPENLNALCETINSTWPQFMQSVKAVFFASEELLHFEQSWYFGDVECWYVTSYERQVATLDLQKSLFKYDTHYADLAKLYTSPYAQLEFFDESGTKTIVNIEDTNGSLALQASLSLVFPFINLNAHINGIGSSETTGITFSNIEARAFNFGGAWASTLKTWNIPTFAIYQSGAKHNEYATYFTRAQAQLALNNSYNAAIATADTGIVNTDVQAAANVDMVATSNSASSDDLFYANENSAGQVNLAQDYAIKTQANEALAETQKTAVGAVAGIAAGAAQGAVSGAGVGGAYGAVGGACLGAIGGIASAVTSGVNTAININLAESKVSLSNNLMDTQRLRSIQADLNRTNLSARTAIATSDIQNTAGKAIALNSATTAKGNAALAKNTAQAAISNQIAQAATTAPLEFGSTANAGSSTTLPQAYFVNVVTQSKSAIAQAGDTFLRYGYALNRQWTFAGFNVMPEFSYWKCSEVWCVGGTNDMFSIAEEAIKTILMQGVTVWRNPSKIGKVSIYDN